jgi:hypothetical protein
LEKKAGVGGKSLYVQSYRSVFGAKNGFFPQNAQEITPNSAQAKVGQKRGKSGACLSIAL